MNDKIESPKQTSVSFASYIVRLYRFQKSKPQRLQGIVEEVETMKKRTFAGYDELWKIFNAHKMYNKKDKNKKSRV
jgi:hypothetical protein